MIKKIGHWIAANFDVSVPVRHALGISVLLLCLDQLSKIWILFFLPSRGISWEVLPVFNLVLSYNYGAGFGAFAKFGALANTALIVLTFVIVIFLLSQMGRYAHRGLHPLRGVNFSIALVLGGALGNVTDRIWRGAVIDFLDFHLGRWHWPAFNIADSAITIGALLWLLHELRNSSQ